MKLKEVRKLGIKYCEENNCNYTYIAHDSTNEFYITEKEDKHTVFLVKKNGGLNAYRGTNYAVDFHKELKKRRSNRRKSGKREIAEIINGEDEVEVVMEIDSQYE